MQIFAANQFNNQNLLKMQFAKKHALAFTLCSIMTLGLFAQNGMLPAKSPKASTSYNIAYTDINIAYSSPAVKGRTLWGDVVPYNEIWRAGANAATTMEFSTEINLEGKKIPAGKYAFFVIPKDGENWTVIFNAVHDQWGAYNYDESKDVLRLELKAKDSKVLQERLKYDIVDQEKTNKGYIKLAWGKKRLYVRFAVNYVDQAVNNVRAEIEKAKEEDKWAIYAAGAEFLNECGKKPDLAEEWINQSTSLKDASKNWYVRAQIQAAKENYADAVSSVEKALEIGPAEKGGYFKREMENMKASMADWKTNL